MMLLSLLFRLTTQILKLYSEVILQPILFFLTLSLISLNWLNGIQTFLFSTISRFETQSIASIKGEDMDQVKIIFSLPL